MYRVASRLLVGVLVCAWSTTALATTLWSSAYYAAWMQETLPPAQIDFPALTHLMHFAILPNADGTLDSEVNVVSEANSADLIARAHRAGVKVLITVGGWNSAAKFRGATSTNNLPVFVRNLINFVKSRGYDGVDVDWETLEAADASQYTALINALRASLDGLVPRRMLTAAVAKVPALFATLQSNFDQLNLMTYDFSGPWPGWSTWFNAPLYDDGFRLPGAGAPPTPSVDHMVMRFLDAGVSAAKLGLGINFYGYVWSGGAVTATDGVSQPRQCWTRAPIMTNVSYAAIMRTYHQPKRYFWDAATQSAYLSVDEPKADDDKFISYDDERSAERKVHYAKEKGLGGISMFELGAGHMAEKPIGARDPLLQAIKLALQNTPADTAAPTVSILSPRNGESVSNTLSLHGRVADNVGVDGIVWQIDGVRLASESASGAQISWNSAFSTNGSHVLTAIATDAAGNRAHASATVIVNNANAVPWIFRDWISSSWTEVSWKALTILNCDCAETAALGGHAIRVTQEKGGAFSVLSGKWGASIPIDPSLYKSVSFTIHGGATAIDLGLHLEAKGESSFPFVRYGVIPAHTMRRVTVSMRDLSPTKKWFERIDFTNLGGPSTYYIADLRLVPR